MASEYQLQILGRDGTQRAVIVNMLSLAYTRRVNTPGILTFTLPPEATAIALLELDGQVVVKYRDVAAGIGWLTDFEGLYRGQRYAVTSDQDEVFTATCPGILHWLTRRIIGYPATTVNFSAFHTDACETIMRTLVATNCTALATVAAGRIRAGALSGISVEADGGRGTVLSWSGAWKSILTALQDLAPIGGGDFDLVKTGPADWVFRFYPGQRGTDRRSGAHAVLFSQTFDNMGEPQLIIDRVDEETVAIVGGQGQETARQVIVRTGPDYSVTNDIEGFVDGRNTQTTASLQADGDRALQTTRARPVLTFLPLETPATRYRREYQLGDLVSASYRGFTTGLKVAGATVAWESDGAEQVTINLEVLP